MDAVRTRIGIAIVDGPIDYFTPDDPRVKEMVNRVWRECSPQERARLGWRGFLRLFWEEMMLRAGGD